MDGVGIRVSRYGHPTVVGRETSVVEAATAPQSSVLESGFTNIAIPATEASPIA
jgi:hypothetical protein